MTHKIIDGIIRALREAFPESKMYTEAVKQGFSKPCFILRLINPGGIPLLKGRYQRTYLFSVQYIPGSELEPGSECHIVCDKLWHVLEYITVDNGLCRGTGMKATYFDGALTFFVNFNLFVKESKDHVKMEDLTLGSNVLDK